MKASKGSLYIELLISILLLNYSVYLVTKNLLNIEQLKNQIYTEFQYES